MNVTAISALKDNYIWLIDEEDQAIIVDPGESKQVLEYLTHNKLTTIAILLTHAHDDHTAGVKDILQEYPELPVYGPEETSELATEILQEGDTITLLDTDFNVLFTPGHTAGHISYLTDTMLFCGDALFSAGCGRVANEAYQAQFDSLQKFKELDDKILAYPAHEYTLSNLEFAYSIQPTNEDIIDALTKAKQLLETDTPTLPTNIGFERQINLFLQAQSVEEFEKLRLEKDNF